MASLSNKCCPATKIASDGTCCEGTTRLLSNGHCCPNNQVYTNGTCQACAAPTPVFSNGICCPTGRVNKGGICCLSAQVNAAGICCAATTPYNVNNTCSACNAAGRVKISGSLEADKCCPTGNIVVTGGICCESSKPFNVNGTCSEKPVCKFVVKGRSGTDFVHDPNYTSQTPQCLKNLIAGGLLGECKTTWVGGKYLDNCVAWLIVTGEYRTLAQGRWRIDEASEDVTLYFDDSCNRVPAPAAGSSSCDAGYYKFGASPIALIWDQSFGVKDLSEDVRLVSFPINPNEPNKLVEWKASSKAPLLVYDPTGEGQITNGYQLFGNWTFGPKRFASLKDDVGIGGGDKLWNNGFDALSKLDIDEDGEVSGTELEHLSLWFDDNRNAVSEKGEVRRLSAAGVKKLFYKGYSNDNSANAIVLNLGFERERDGKTEQGAMADWFTETVSSELEYAQKAMITSAVSKTDKIESSAIARLNNASSNHTEITKDGIKDESVLLAYKKGAALISGIWEWSSDSEKIPVSGGRFIILDNEDGTISGLTIIELPVESTIGAKSVGLVKGFMGKAKLENNGSVSVAFKLKESDGTTILQSSAKLEKSGTSMNGSSSGKIKSKAANTDISYTWVATKLK